MDVYQLCPVVQSPGVAPLLSIILHFSRSLIHLLLCSTLSPDRALDRYLTCRTEAHLTTNPVVQVLKPHVVLVRVSWQDIELGQLQLSASFDSFRRLLGPRVRRYSSEPVSDTFGNIPRGRLRAYREA